MDPAALYSRLAANGPPLFFPDPPSPVTFNLDQGIPAEETFPVEDLKRLAGQILDTDGPRALEYISFGYEDDEERLLYLATYIELVLGYKKSNRSPILKLLLSRLDELVARVSKKAH